MQFFESTMPPFLFCLSILSYHCVHVSPSLCWLLSQSPMIKKSSDELFLQMQAIASCSDWSFEAGTVHEWGPSNAYCLYSNAMYYKGCVCVCTDMCLYNLHTACVCVCVCPLSSDHGILKKQDLSGLRQSESMVDLIGTLKCKH